MEAARCICKTAFCHHLSVKATNRSVFTPLIFPCSWLNVNENFLNWRTRLFFFVVFFPFMSKTSFLQFHLEFRMQVRKGEGCLPFVFLYVPSVVVGNLVSKNILLWEAVLSGNHSYSRWNLKHMKNTSRPENWTQDFEPALANDEEKTRNWKGQQTQTCHSRCALATFSNFRFSNELTWMGDTLWLGSSSRLSKLYWAKMLVLWQ